MLFLEHKHLLRQKLRDGPLTPADYVIPLGKAATVRPGERPHHRHVGCDGASARWLAAEQLAS